MVLVSRPADNSHPLTPGTASGSSSHAAASSAVQTRSATLDRPAIEKPIRSRSPLTKQARTSEIQPMDSPIEVDESQNEGPAASHLPVPAAPEQLSSTPSQGSLGTFPAAQPDSTPQFAGGPPPSASAPRGRSGHNAPSPSAASDATDFDSLVAEAMKTTVLPLLDTQKIGILENVTAALLNNNKIVGEQCHNICTQACSKANEAINQRLDNLEGAVTTIGEDTAKLQGKVDELSDKLGKVLSSLGHSNSLPNLQQAAQNNLGNPAAAPPTQSVTTPLFHRTPDPTRLYVNIHNKAMVPLVSFNSAFEALAADCGQDPNLFEVTGDALDNRFDIRYLGPKGAATAACLTLYQSIFLGRGKYKETVCKDERNNAHKFYINPDRNGCQIRREILCKELSKILSACLPRERFVVQKTSGSVLFQRRVLATVIVVDPMSARIQWMPAPRISLGLIDEVLANVEAQFSDIAGGANRP